MSSKKQRKIIHIDMDCFFAAVHERDDPSLKTKPIAVGGDSDKRGVIATANYEARKHGIRSAMATAYAKRLCPDLILMKSQMALYKEISNNIRVIFRQYSDLVEPLSLDEAFIDVTNSEHCQGSAILMAKEIRKKIFDKEKLTASAGISVNKFLAKIASDWNKPNGQFAVLPENVATFVQRLPVRKIFGVGPKTAAKLNQLGIFTCSELQSKSQVFLIEKFGKFGELLFNLARGIDEREVNPNRQRKSVSVEETYAADLASMNDCLKKVLLIKKELEERLTKMSDPFFNKVFIKIKFHDFTQTTVETVGTTLDDSAIKNLLSQGLERGENKKIRLLGLGVRLNQTKNKVFQLELFP